jgi:hypothetical protein
MSLPLTSFSLFLLPRNTEEEGERSRNMLIISITPAPMLLAYHFFSVALYSIYILFTSGVPPMPGQKAHVPRIHEYPYTMYLAFRVVSLPLHSYPLILGLAWG